MKKDWLVYRVTYGSVSWHVELQDFDYKERDKDSITSRIIIKKNLSYHDARNFRKVLNKLRK